MKRLSFNQKRLKRGQISHQLSEKLGWLSSERTLMMRGKELIPDPHAANV